MNSKLLRFLLPFVAILGVNCATLPQGQAYTRILGWAQGQRVYYYNFVNGIMGNLQTLPTAPLYYIKASNSITAPDLQPSVIDVAPGDAGYSDLWSVNIVVVTNQQAAGTMMSLAAINTAVSSGYATINPTNSLINGPVVGAGSTLQSQDAPKYPLVQSYYKGQMAYWFNFGANPDMVLPILALVPIGSSTPVPNQNIVALMPGQVGYTAFWWVETIPVAANYSAGTFTSVQQLATAPKTPANVMVNCPIVQEDSAVTGDVTAMYSIPAGYMAKSANMLATVLATLIFLMAYFVA